MKVDIYDLLDVYENNIVKNIKNKRKLLKFESSKINYLVEIKRILENNLYDGGYYNIFVIFDPKIRVIMSQRLIDKIINHYLTKYILYPKLEHLLIDENCATRKDMGTSYAIKHLKKDIEYFKRYKEFYFLKFDIKKYFYSIDQKVLLAILEKNLTDDEYIIFRKIIYSTNHKYVNENILSLSKKLNVDLPIYEYGKGLSLGAVSNQFLAILYLYKLHHYIKHNLKIKRIKLYMDDYLLIHEDKNYLKYALDKITYILENEYKLKLNEKKTQIVKMDKGIVFLGYKIIVKNNKTIIKLSRARKDKIKKKVRNSKYKYENQKLDFYTYYQTIQTYKYSYGFSSKKEIENTLEKYL